MARTPNHIDVYVRAHDLQCPYMPRRHTSCNEEWHGADTQCAVMHDLLLDRDLSNWRKNQVVINVSGDITDEQIAQLRHALGESR